VWRRTSGQLTYSLLGLHKLVPPPSRVNSNATISLLCAAAAAWTRCDADPGCNSGSEAAESGCPRLESLPPDSLGATARALLVKGRKLSTIYSRVSTSGSSNPTEVRNRCLRMSVLHSSILIRPKVAQADLEASVIWRHL
jgi:hypothetical protein